MIQQYIIIIVGGRSTMEIGLPALDVYEHGPPDL